MVVTASADVTCSLTGVGAARMAANSGDTGFNRRVVECLRSHVCKVSIRCWSRVVDHGSRSVIRHNKCWCNTGVDASSVKAGAMTGVATDVVDALLGFVVRTQ